MHNGFRSKLPLLLTFCLFTSFLPQRMGAASNTQFRIKFRAQDNLQGFSGYKTEYEGDIPNELVTRDYNRFTLALGQLKIPDEALRPGVNVDIEVVATRSLGICSAKQLLAGKVQSASLDKI